MADIIDAASRFQGEVFSCNRRLSERLACKGAKIASCPIEAAE